MIPDVPYLFPLGVIQRTSHAKRECSRFRIKETKLLWEPGVSSACHETPIALIRFT